MPQTSERQNDLQPGEQESEAERLRRIRLMQLRISARKRAVRTQNVSAQAVERMTGYMLTGVIIAAICTVITVAAVGYGLMLRF